jgi:large-conductance mechanosensitive channel
MGRKEEAIIRPAVGIMLGIAISALFASISRDILTPIIKQKSFDDEEKRLVYTFSNGVRIHFGEVLGHLVTVTFLGLNIYFWLSVLEYYKVF